MRALGLPRFAPVSVTPTAPTLTEYSKDFFFGRYQMHKKSYNQLTQKVAVCCSQSRDRLRLPRWSVLANNGDRLRHDGNLYKGSGWKNWGIVLFDLLLNVFDIFSYLRFGTFVWIYVAVTVARLFNGFQWVCFMVSIYLGAELIWLLLGFEVAVHHWFPSIVHRLFPTFPWL